MKQSLGSEPDIRWVSDEPFMRKTKFKLRWGVVLYPLHSGCVILFKFFVADAVWLLMLVSLLSVWFEIWFSVKFNIGASVLASSLVWSRKTSFFSKSSASKRCAVSPTISNLIGPSFILTGSSRMYSTLGSLSIDASSDLPSLTRSWAIFWKNGGKSF